MPAREQLRLDDQLCFALYAATNSITRAYRPLLDELGLTYAQYLVLMVLWQQSPMSISEIAGRLDISAHGLSPLLDRIESAGLVRRERDATDRRVVQVHLTAAGAQLETAAARAQRIVACDTGLSPDGLADLREQLHSLVDRMGAQEATPVVPDQSPRSPR